MAREPAREDDRPSDEGAVRKPFLLRLSPEVFDALRGWSAQEMRSVNAHIEYLLRKALAERQSGKGKRS